ncbi:MAG UNVERIFIED_CONTAM: hypothetical protein LVT10_04315 [Anaerolineae bacterium]|jgi:hypothetical protein
MSKAIRLALLLVFVLLGSVGLVQAQDNPRGNHLLHDLHSNGSIFADVRWLRARVF